MTMKVKPHLTKIIGLSLFLFACTQVDVSGLDPDLFTNAGGGGGGNTDELCADVDATFSTKVLPIFDAKCNNSGCHGSNSEGGQLNLDSDDNRRGDGASGVIGNIKQRGALNAFSAAQSAILLKPLATAEGGQSGTHTGGEIFNNTVNEDYKTIFCWIDAGAKNDLDDSQCTFGEHVYRVFRDRGCTDCHTSSHATLNLTQGSDALLNGTTKAFGTTGNEDIVIPGDTASLLLTKPLNTVSHGTNGDTQVFDNTQDVDYQTLKCWIDEGAQDN